MASTEVRELLAATTAAGNSTGFSVNADNPTSVFVTGLAGAETGTLQVTIDNGETFTDATDADGTIQATAAQNSFLVVGPGEYRIAKSATAGSVAVTVAG